jgi:2-keto-4-pentenoate hydratase/2-oxohepta-3-ene-1,7-dioic acid hydratase in catechol pathway
MLDNIAFHYAKLKNGHLAAVANQQIVGLVEAASRLGMPLRATSLHELIAAGAPAQAEAKALVYAALEQRVACTDYDSRRLQTPLGQVKRNIFCIGKNYAEHAAEIAAKLDTGTGVPEHPVVFTKATNTLIGPHEEIPLHAGVTEKIDYEGELAIVIGQRGRDIAPAQAWQYVFGYSCFNDVSARDLQHRHMQWHLGKSLDGFAPMGPVVTPTYGQPLAGDIELTCAVNGEVRQRATLDLMVFDVPTIIATLSKGITLEPGDVIATGTPAGVGMGFTPSKFLQPGDKVEVSIDGTLPLENCLARE